MAYLKEVDGTLEDINGILKEINEPPNQLKGKY
jgi:hypothetical protein